MPLAGLFLMPQGIEEGNHEMLLLTSLNRWQIVFGKFLTLWLLSQLTLTSLLPYIIRHAPFIFGMVAAFTCGFRSIAGTILLTFLAWNSDRTLKALKWIIAPKANIPTSIPPIQPVPLASSLPTEPPVS